MGTYCSSSFFSLPSPPILQTTYSDVNIQTLCTMARLVSVHLIILPSCWILQNAKLVRDSDIDDVCGQRSCWWWWLYIKVSGTRNQPIMQEWRHQGLLICCHACRFARDGYTLGTVDTPPSKLPSASPPLPSTPGRPNVPGGGLLKSKDRSQET